MSEPTDTTAPRRVVCARCVDRQREIRSLEDRLDGAHATIRGLRSNERSERDVNVQSTMSASAFVLLLVVVGAGLWALGRLAVWLWGAA